MLRASLTMPRGDPYGVGCSCHWLCWRKETDLSVASGKRVVLEQLEAMKLSCSKHRSRWKSSDHTSMGVDDSCRWMSANHTLFLL